MPNRRPPLLSVLLVLCLVFSLFAFFSALQTGYPGITVTGLTRQAMAEGFSTLSSCTYSVYSGPNRVAVRTRSDGHKINLVNNNSFPVWVGVIGNDVQMIRNGEGKLVEKDGWGLKIGFLGPGTDPGNSWKISPNETTGWCAPNILKSNRFWARTGCYTSAGVFKCRTGDCGGKTTNDICIISGSRGVSVAEFTFDSYSTSQSQQKIYYDAGFVDGYDFPITIAAKRNSTCKTMGCYSSQMPTSCLTTVDGKYTNGYCPAPYVHYQFKPENKYNADSAYFAIGSMCAKDNVCGCAISCKDPKTNCPDMSPATNKYLSGINEISLLSGGCSPINAFYGFDQALFAPNSIFWNQTPCDPVSGVGSYYAPYILDGTLLGKRAIHVQQRPVRPDGRRTWQAGDSYTVKGTDFFRYRINSTAGTRIGPIMSNHSTTTVADLTQAGEITAYIEKDIITASNNELELALTSTIDHDIYPLSVNPLPAGRDVPESKHVTITRDSADQLTVTIPELPADPNNFTLVGTDYPITLNVASRDISCRPWPNPNSEPGSRYVNYVTGIRSTCKNVYTWQYDDLAGLGSCTYAEPDIFTITFDALPQGAVDSNDLIQFTAGGTARAKLVKGAEEIRFYETDSAYTSIGNQETVDVNVYCNPEQTYAAQCTARYIAPKDPGAGVVTSRSFTVEKGLSYCSTNFGTFNQQTLQVSFSPTSMASTPQFCTDTNWNGSFIEIIPPAAGYPTDFTIPDNNIAKSTINASPFPARIPEGGAITVRVYCDAGKTTAAPECSGTFDTTAGKFINITGGTYCSESVLNTITNNAGYYRMTVTPPAPTKCFPVAWKGDPVYVYPLQNSNGTNVRVPGNNIDKTTMDSTPYQIMMRIGDIVYLRVYGEDRTKAGICQATYDGTVGGSITFSEVKSPDGKADVWCKNIFKTNGIHVQDYAAVGSSPYNSAYIVNSGNGKSYYDDALSAVAMLQTSLDEAVSGNILRALAMPILEDGGLIFNTGQSVTFHGGYAAIDDTSPSETGYTTVKGPLFIRSGMLTVNRLKLR